MFRGWFCAAAFADEDAPNAKVRRPSASDPMPATDGDDDPCRSPRASEAQSTSREDPSAKSCTVHIPALVPTTTKPPAAAAHVATAPRPGALFATSSSSNVRADGSSEAPVEAERREDDVAPSSDTARSLVSRPSAPLAISARPPPRSPVYAAHECERLLFVRPERVRGRVRSSQKLGLCLNCLPVVFTNLNYGHVNDTVVPWPRVRTRSLRQQPKISRRMQIAVSDLPS